MKREVWTSRLEKGTGRDLFCLEPQACSRSCAQRKFRLSAWLDYAITLISALSLPPSYQPLFALPWEKWGAAERAGTVGGGRWEHQGHRVSTLFLVHLCSSAGGWLPLAPQWRERMASSFEWHDLVSTCGPLNMCVWPSSPYDDLGSLCGKPSEFLRVQ